MLISTRGRYALRLMLDLACVPPDEYRPVRSIAENQEVSAKYLEQILLVLNRAGMVISQRGAHGGYRLAKSPHEYTVGEVLSLIEGGLAPVTCMENADTDCKRAAQCATLDLWRQIERAVHKVVDNITLADLLLRQEAKLAGLDDGLDFSV